MGENKQPGVCLLCWVRFPEDDRFSASGIARLPYTKPMTEGMVVSDCRNIFDEGQDAVDWLVENGLVTTDALPDKAFIPAGFPVSYQLVDGTTVVVRG